MKTRRRLAYMPRWYRRLFITVRDVVVLLRQFRTSLLVFSLAVVGGGSLYYVLARQAGETHPASWAESLFLVLSMAFLQANVDFPAAWHLGLFFFVMPVVGLGALAQGAADFGVLLFNRRARGEAWQVAVADTYSDHIVIVGMGHLGFRVARALHQLGENFIIIEQNPEAELISHADDWQTPVIQGDSLKHSTLKLAGVDRAHTIVIATNDDTTNLQIAIHARAVNPNIRTIIRLFDDDFAREVRNAFGITAAYSASALAAPAFAAAAAGLDIPEALTVNGRVLNMSHFTVHEGSSLVGLSIDEVENSYDCSVVLLRRGQKADLHPHNDLVLQAGDLLTIFAAADTLHALNRDSR